MERVLPENTAGPLLDSGKVTVAYTPTLHDVMDGECGMYITEVKSALDAHMMLCYKVELNQMDNPVKGTMDELKSMDATRRIVLDHSRHLMTFAPTGSWAPLKPKHALALRAVILHNQRSQKLGDHLTEMTAVPYAKDLIALLTCLAMVLPDKVTTVNKHLAFKVYQSKE